MLSFVYFSEDTAKELDFINFEELTYALHSLRLFFMMSSSSIIINVLPKMLFWLLKIELENYQISYCAVGILNKAPWANSTFLNLDTKWLGEHWRWQIWKAPDVHIKFCMAWFLSFYSLAEVHQKLGEVPADCYKKPWAL